MLDSETYPAQDNTIEGNRLSGNRLDLALLTNATTGGTCFARNRPRTTSPAGLERATRCGEAAAIAVGRLPAIRAPPQVDYRTVPAPPAQPNMPQARTRAGAARDRQPGGRQMTAAARARWPRWRRCSAVRGRSPAAAPPAVRSPSRR